MPSPENSKNNEKRSSKKRKKNSASDIDSSTGEVHKETGLTAGCNTKANTNTQRVGNKNKNKNKQSTSETIAEGNRTLYDFDSSSILQQDISHINMQRADMTSTPINNNVITNTGSTSSFPSHALAQSQAQAQYTHHGNLSPQTWFNPMMQYPQNPVHMNMTQSSDQPPKWAQNMFDFMKTMNEDMKNIKSSLTKIDLIQSTVNSIERKFIDLESKVKTIDTRVKETEAACSFMSDQTEQQKNDLKTANSKITDLNKQCRTLTDNMQSLKQERDALETKIVDLECRSMQENLLFYGVNESTDENCEILVKQFCKEVLKIEESDSYKIDRAHRIGSAQSKKPRPIVVKFHSYQDREQIRSKSYNDDIAKALKESKQGVGIQWPKQIREARKELRPIMLKERDRGNSVKMVKDKLYVNGRLVNPADYEDETARGNMVY